MVDAPAAKMATVDASAVMVRSFLHLRDCRGVYYRQFTYPSLLTTGADFTWASEPGVAPSQHTLLGFPRRITLTSKTGARDV